VTTLTALIWIPIYLVHVYLAETLILIGTAAILVLAGERLFSRRSLP